MNVLRSDLLSTHLNSVAAVSPEHPMLAHTVVYEGSGKLGLELAIYPLPPPQGEFWTLWFSETTLYKTQNKRC